MNKELQKKIESILSRSDIVWGRYDSDTIDIVWGRYGSDTIKQLAARIVAVITTKER